MIKHVVWDWNSTLYDDIAAVLSATNAAIAAFGRAPIDMAEYQRHYERPMHRYYERMLGHPISEEQMEQINLAFHHEYSLRMREVALASDAPAGLESVAAAGISQSVLSMWVQHELRPLVSELGLDAYFVHVEGQPQATHLGKTEALKTHLQTLRDAHAVNAEPGEIVMIGDTIDDGRAASAAGIRCLLVSTGSDSAERLAQEPWPVFASITAALEHVEIHR